MSRLLHILLLLSLVLPQAQAGVPEIDLRDTWDYLPYEAKLVLRFLPGTQNYPSASRTCLFVDLDDDGQDELVRSTANGVVVEKMDADGTEIMRWDLPAEFTQPGQSAFGLALCPDFNDDGRPEITAIGHTSDQFDWRLWVLDTSNQTIISTTRLPRGTDIRPDGRWDGLYLHATCLGRDPASGLPPLLILTCNVSYDRDGRGVLAIDPLSGQLLWVYATAGLPGFSSLIAGDFDNDGAQEIIFTVDTAPLPTGLIFNGYSDGESRVVLLDNTGRVRWSAPLGEGLGGTDLEVVDLDADGRPEIVTTQWMTPEPSGALRVWDLDGALLAEYKSPLQYNGLALVRPTTDSSPELLVTTSFGTLEVFRYTPEILTQTLIAHLPTSCTINGVLDFLPEPGPEIVITDKTGRVLVLNTNYAPLALFNTDPMTWLGAVQKIRPTAGVMELVRRGARQGSLSFRPNAAPTALAQPGLATYVVIGLTLVTLGWLMLRYRRGRPAPEFQHEVRLHLLESLELSRHGDIAPLNAIRRLNFCLRALKTDIGDTSRVHIRLGEILTECQEASLPHLTGIMDRARLANLDSRNVAAANLVLGMLRRLVGKLAAAESLVDPDDELLAELGDAEKVAERSLRKLRQEVALFFQADPQRSLERVLLANQDRLQQAGVRVMQTELALAAAGGSDSVTTTSPEAQSLPSGTCCLIDEADLDQVLDNVIANAVQAMQHTAVKQLRISRQLLDGMVMIDVSDTGCGIAPSDHDRALNTHYSTKNGGGTGLPASRKILHRYSGRLMILRSEPGRGTTIRIATIAS